MDNRYASEVIENKENSASDGQCFRNDFRPMGNPTEALSGMRIPRRPPRRGYFAFA
jgi:hypothetical protein